jgi:hypothetical protein
MSYSQLTAAKQKQLNRGVALIEQAFDCTLWAIVATDDKGVFVHARPESEVDVFKWFAGANWQHAILVASEHWVS